MKFKVGDRIAITDNEYLDSRYKIGDTGHIVETRQDGYFTLKMYDDEYQLSYGGDFKKIKDDCTPVVKKPKFPQRGHNYYMISWTGDIVMMTYVDDTADRMAIEFGNIFETREQALIMAYEIKKLFKEKKKVNEI